MGNFLLEEKGGGVYILMEKTSPHASKVLLTFSVIVKHFAQHQIPVLATITMIDTNAALLCRHLTRSIRLNRAKQVTLGLEDPENTQETRSTYWLNHRMILKLRKGEASEDIIIIVGQKRKVLITYILPNQFHHIILIILQMFSRMYISLIAFACR